jgi:hypothetical protein
VTGQVNDSTHLNSCPKRAGAHIRLVVDLHADLPKGVPCLTKSRANTLWACAMGRGPLGQTTQARLIPGGDSTDGSMTYLVALKQCPRP